MARWRWPSGAQGGENDGPSRNLSRYIAGLAAADKTGIAVRQIWRADRIGRGGDHLPFEEMGFPAVRITVGLENYEHQHQDVRQEGAVAYGDTIGFMDFPYLAKVTRLNIRAAAAIAAAPMPPTVSERGLFPPIRCWNGPPCRGGRLSRVAPPHRCSRVGTKAPAAHRHPGATFKGLRADDWFLGVSALPPMAAKARSPARCPAAA
jgi:hypothetical protein